MYRITHLHIDIGSIYFFMKPKSGEQLSTPETQFSEPRFSEILKIMNKLQLTFLYMTLYPDSI